MQNIMSVLLNYIGGTEKISVVLVTFHSSNRSSYTSWDSLPNQYGETEISRSDKPFIGIGKSGEPAF